MHENEIVHGDIKSDNIMLDKHFEPKIGDFGAVRFLYTRLEKPDTHIIVKNQTGTEIYLPRWYVAGEGKVAVRKPVDIFSFGVVLMEILSNRIVSTNGADGQNLRHFIDSIGQYEAPPPDFITSVDSDNSSFLHQGKEYWLTEIFFHWGKDCTKTGTQMAKETPRPWLCLPKIDVIHNEFSGMYLYYNPNLSENEREILDPESQSQFMSELMSH